MDVAWLLRERATRYASDVFLIWEPFDADAQQWTYAQFYQDVCTVATALSAAGLKSGDRLLIHADNSPGTLMVWFASALLGSVAVTTNTAATLSELSYYVEHVGAIFAVCDAAHVRLLCALDALEYIATLDAAGVPIGTDRRVHALVDLRADSAATFHSAVPDWRRPLSIQFTSGSTSRPKAVLWTHGNAVWGARFSALHQRLQRDDVSLVYLPFFHTNAQTYSILPCLWAGARIVLQPKFSVSRFWSISLRHRVTRTSMVPFCLRALFTEEVPVEHAYRTWGLGVVHPEAEARFRVKVLGWWGMTETVSHPIVSDQCAEHPFMSMGYVAPGYEVEIRNERGQRVVEGIGDLYVRGQRGLSLFLEYAGDPAATERAFDADGWFNTGDRARWGASGDVFFAGRSSDVMKCGGENVSAAEIEAVIATVEGVRENAVVARADKAYGAVPVAYVISKADATHIEARILERCRQELAAFKVPREIFVVTELPRAALNKVAKAQLQAMANPS
jgi:crotonobetaine/carnitine-CoA ligase